MPSVTALYCDRARADHAQSVPRRPPAPELPPVLDRPDAVADRHVDADDGAGLAGAGADQQRLPRRPRRDGVARSRSCSSRCPPAPSSTARTSCASCASRRSRSSSRRPRSGGSPRRITSRSAGCSRLAFIGGLIASIEIPARQAMMIDLVGRDDLPGRDRAQLERLQSRARRRTRHRRGGHRPTRHRVVLLPERGELHRRARRPVHDAAARPGSPPGSARARGRESSR